jgi:hypothetical protein
MKLSTILVLLFSGALAVAGLAYNRAPAPPPVFGPGSPAPSVSYDGDEPMTWDELAESQAASFANMPTDYFRRMRSSAYTAADLRARHSIDHKHSDAEIEAVRSEWLAMVDERVDQAEAAMLLEMQNAFDSAPKWLNVAPIDHPLPERKTRRGRYLSSVDASEGGWHGWAQWDSADFPEINSLLDEVKGLRQLENDALRSELK